MPNTCRSHSNGNSLARLRYVHVKHNTVRRLNSLALTEFYSHLLVELPRFVSHFTFRYRLGVAKKNTCVY